MALHTGSGFSKLARTESQIHAILATIIEVAVPKHQPFVSKKKEAKRRRLEQEEALALLRNSSLDDIEFVPFQIEQPTEASLNKIEMDELENQMRLALGIGEVTLSATAPVAAKSKPVVPSPDILFIQPAPKATPRKEVHFAKRTLEVLLQVLRTDGTAVPFYHQDDCVSHLTAEINAAKKARKYGLQVLHTISVTCVHKDFDRA
jgi:hypothetical protein